MDDNNCFHENQLGMETKVLRHMQVPTDNLPAPLEQNLDMSVPPVFPRPNVSDVNSPSETRMTSPRLTPNLNTDIPDVSTIIPLTPVQVSQTTLSRPFQSYDPIFLCQSVCKNRGKIDRFIPGLHSPAGYLAQAFFLHLCL